MKEIDVKKHREIKSLKVPTKNSLLFYLDYVEELLEDFTPEHIEICEIIELLEKNLGELVLSSKKGGNGFKAEITLINVDPEKEEETKKKIKKALENGYVRETIREFLLPKKEEKLHKQPLAYLKTTSKLVGRDTNNPTLFTMPEILDLASSQHRDIISKNTAILGNYILQLMQQTNSKELEMTGYLSTLSEMFGVNKTEIKNYLLYLGGYVYPITDKDEKSGKLTLTTEQLFKVKFIYSKEVAERSYKTIGTNLTRYLIDQPVESIVIEPSPIFIKALEGKGLGNVLVKNNDWVRLAQSLTETGYKLLAYTTSNKPKNKINEDSLIRDLGLEEAVKKQGKPRVRATILKAFEELKTNGHFKEYLLEEEPRMYSYTYSDKYVEHSNTRREKRDLEGGKK